MEYIKRKGRRQNDRIANAPKLGIDEEMGERDGVKKKKGENSHRRTWSVQFYNEMQREWVTEHEYDTY